MSQRGNIDVDQIQAYAKGALLSAMSLSGVDHSGLNLVLAWLAVGADGDVLVADSTSPFGIRWAAPGSGSGGAITTHTEILTDSSGPILSNGDYIYVLGVPN